MIDGRGKLVLTRPQAQADVFAKSIHQSIENNKLYDGLESDYSQFKERHIVFSPVTEVVYYTSDLPAASQIDAVILTSANAISGLAVRGDVLSAFREKPLYVVGQATALKARKSGFENIVLVTPTVEILLGEIGVVLNVRPEARFLYLRGWDIRKDICSHFPEAAIVDAVTYEAVALKTLPREMIAEIRQGNIGAVAFFSARSTMIFCELAKDCGLAEDINGIKALCMSSAMLEYAQPLFGGEVYVSETPDSGSMLNLVQDVFIKGIVNR